MAIVMDTRPGAYCVIIEQGKILLTHFHSRDAQGKPISGWTLPGGGIEIGEQAAEAAQREAREETGYTIAIENLLGVHAAYFTQPKGTTFCAFRTVYSARILGGSLVCEVGGSTDAVRWVELTQLDSYLPSVSSPQATSMLDAVAGMLGHQDAAAWAASARQALGESA